ncbi:MAG: DUF1501 domain-containing protein [Ignavibacteria bacterium]
MKNFSRRNFLKYSAMASTSLLIPNFLKGFQSKELYDNTLLQKLISGGKKLIIVQLSGGNDGLNTIVPYRNDIYFSMRPGLSLSENKIVKLNDELGLNSAMSSMKNIFDNGNMSIINSVGYPNPDRSHFRSMDIWQSGSGSDQYLSTGWIGRYLDSECESCKNPYSAIEVDSTLNMTMKGLSKSGMAIEDPKKFYINSSERYLLEVSQKAKDHDHEDSNVSYLYKTLAETTSSAEYVYENSKIYKSKKDYPDTTFGNNLKTIAEMIISNINTTVYYVSMSGFDTHVNQKGRQEKLLSELSAGLSSLTEDLKENNKLDETLILTFSEFGRRVQQNASGGTDHGTANNLFLIGGKLKTAGIYNSAPDLSNLKDGDLQYEIDFRSVYATILNKWLGADDSLILGKDFNYLNFL